jgi:hypothetical protein
VLIGEYQFVVVTDHLHVLVLILLSIPVAAFFSGLGCYSTLLLLQYYYYYYSRVDSGEVSCFAFALTHYRVKLYYSSTVLCDMSLRSFPFSTVVQY